MPNGHPNDHPLTDILVHGIDVYGAEADELIRKISKLCAPKDLSEWWEAEIGWSGDQRLALSKAKLRYDELYRRAVDGGWEIDKE